MIKRRRRQLSPLKQAFVRYYFLTKGNATLAAQKAGYSRKTAYSQGSRLLKSVEVREAIEEGLARRNEKGILTADARDMLLSEFAEREGASLKERIRAVDILNKTEGRYSSTLNVRDKTYEELLADSRK